MIEMTIAAPILLVLLSMSLGAWIAFMFTASAYEIIITRQRILIDLMLKSAP